MTLQTSGKITHADIEAEFQVGTPIKLSNYYDVSAGVPAAGTIKESDFYGESSVPPPPMIIWGEELKNYSYTSGTEGHRIGNEFGGKIYFDLLKGSYGCTNIAVSPYSVYFHFRIRDWLNDMGHGTKFDGHKIKWQWGTSYCKDSQNSSCTTNGTPGTGSSGYIDANGSQRHVIGTYDISGYWSSSGAERSKTGQTSTYGNNGWGIGEVTVSGVVADYGNNLRFYMKNGTNFRSVKGSFRDNQYGIQVELYK